jgi:hypothetical protein
MTRIQQLDLLNEVITSHDDDDDDGKLWFTIFTTRRQTIDKRVKWRIHCTFDEAKQIYGIVIGTLLPLVRQPGVMPKEQLLRTGGFSRWLRVARRAQHLQPAFRAGTLYTCV